MKSYKTQRKLSLTFRYLLLVILALLWIFPVIWMILTSFAKNNNTGFVQSLFPQNWTLENYIGIFNNSQYPYAHWQIGRAHV